MELYHVNNKNNFHKIWEKSVEYKLRNNILEFLLSRESEDDYYDLDKQILIYGEKLVSRIIPIIISELENLKWKTKLSFGNTGLFIYSTSEPPKTCW